MKEVFRNADSALVGLYQSMLNDAGIDTFMHNFHSQQIAGGVVAFFFPLWMFQPTLSVVHAEDYPEAMRILRELRDDNVNEAPDWKCAKCGASAPGNFEACWSCDSPRGEASVSG